MCKYRMFIYLKLLKEAPIKNSGANLKKVEEPPRKKKSSKLLQGHGQSKKRKLLCGTTAERLV